MTKDPRHAWFDALANAMNAWSDGAGLPPLDPAGDAAAARAVQALQRLVAVAEQRVAAVEASERIQRELIEALTEGVVYQDDKDRILGCNEAAPRILGLTRDQLLGRSSLDPRWRAIHPDGSPFDFTQHPSVLALRTGQPVRNVLMGVELPAGGRVWVSINSQPLLAPDRPEPYATVTSFSDITARVEAEQLLGHANEVLERRVAERTAELARARDEAEAANRAKSDFLSRMSHELRTPLNAILGFAQLLSLRFGASDDHEALSRLQHIEDAGWHLLSLINEVLDLSRIEAGAIAMTQERIELVPLLSACLRMVEPMARERRLSVVDLSAVLAGQTLQGDATRLRQVITNLLSNACKYNRHGGTLTLRGELQGEQVLIAVEDTGPGLDAQQLASLFEPFNRLGAERGPVEGTGIGLVISKRLAELMGGELRASSQLGVGSRFELRLPRSREGRDAPPSLVASQGPASPR
jgi:PAS domain S-box-containing protein